MIAHEVARTYAQALFLSAKDKNTLDSAYEQLTALSDVLKRPEGKQMLNFLLAPNVLDDKKESLVRTVLGARLDKLLTEFLIVLLNKHRIGFLANIIQEFLLLVENHRKMGRVKVTTAIKLSEAERTSLIQQMEKKTGLKIQLEEKVDPAILGGMILMLNDKVIDGSVRYELSVLRDQLSKVKVA